MKRWVAGVSLLIGLVGAGSAAAENYRYVATSDGYVIYLNTARTRENLSVRTVWLTSVYGKPRDVGMKIKADYFVQQWDVSCDDGRIRDRAKAFYTDQGLVVGTADLIGEWQTVFPGTIGDTIVDVVCKPHRPDENPDIDSDLKYLLEVSRIIVSSSERQQAAEQK